MAQWVLKANGNVVPRRTTRPLNVDELHSEIEIKKRQTFDTLIRDRWGTSDNPIKPDESGAQRDPYETYEDDDEVARVLPEVEDAVDINGTLFN